MSLSRPLKVILYAAFVGLLLASYVAPLQEILQSKSRIPALQANVERAKKDNAARSRLVEELQTPDGIERAAREHYGMIKPGEKVYIVPEDPKEEER